MKKHAPKRQPTRDDLASVLHTIRDQSQIIGLQAKTISRQLRTHQKPDANKRSIALKKSKHNASGSPDRYVN
jgi:predicted ATPase